MRKDILELWANIKSFELVKTCLTHLLLVCASALLGCGPEEQKAPNIVIIYADDLGYGDLGSYNSDSKIPTLHLDRLADEGMRFTDGHCSSGICTPSRYALLTGRHHWRKFHGIVSSFGDSAFDAEELTLPEMLQELGYATAAIGKWHLGWDWAAIRKEGAKPRKAARRNAVWGPEAYDWAKPIPNGPLAHGFDYYFGDTVINFPPYCWIENDRVVEAPDTMMDTGKWKPTKEGNWEARGGPMLTGWDPYDNIPMTTERGVEKIHELAKQDQPFLLYFAFPSPHAPIIPNDEFDGTSEAGPYGDFVVETDAACGRLMAALEEAGVADNTIVIFSADNGPENYAYPRDENFDHWSAEPLRGLKRDIYEGGHRVPFIVKWPGKVEAGAVSEALVSQIDLMATLAAALGYELPDDQAVDSHDLLPLLTGKTHEGRRSHVHNTFKDTYAMRDGDWLLIEGQNGYHNNGYKDWEKRRDYPADNTLTVELYNLRSDIEQSNDLAAEYPEKVVELQALLKKIREQGYSAPQFAPSADI